MEGTKERRREKRKEGGKEGGEWRERDRHWQLVWRGALSFASRAPPATLSSQLRAPPPRHAAACRLAEDSSRN
eukprot:2900461-Rhodomonas_salina.2